MDCSVEVEEAEVDVGGWERAMKLLRAGCLGEQRAVIESACVFVAQADEHSDWQLPRDVIVDWPAAFDGKTASATLSASSLLPANQPRLPSQFSHRPCLARKARPQASFSAVAQFFPLCTL